MLCCMVPIITELCRHAMYHFLHVTHEQHLVTCCKQDQSKCASSNVHAMCDRMTATASNLRAIRSAISAALRAARRSICSTADAAESCTVLLNLGVVSFDCKCRGHYRSAFRSKRKRKNMSMRIIEDMMTIQHVKCCSQIFMTPTRV